MRAPPRRGCLERSISASPSWPAGRPFAVVPASQKARTEPVTVSSTQLRTSSYNWCSTAVWLSGQYLSGQRALSCKEMPGVQRHSILRARPRTSGFLASIRPICLPQDTTSQFAPAIILQFSRKVCAVTCSSRMLSSGSLPLAPSARSRASSPPEPAVCPGEGLR